MKRVFHAILIIVLCCFLVPGCGKREKIDYPETKKIKVVDKVHGVEIIDNYRWLENKQDPEVQAWLKEQNRFSQTMLENLPIRPWLHDRFSYYAKYHKDLVFDAVEAGERSFRIGKKTVEGVDNWFILYREKEDAPEKELVNLDKYGKNIDPVMSIPYPSPDGKHLVFTVEFGGRENSLARLLEVDTGKILPEKLKGSRHTGIKWLPDSSGFYYAANPRKGEVPPREEYFWPAVYFHKMGTPTAGDKKVFFHPTKKELYNRLRFTASKKYLLFERSSMVNDNNEIYYKKVGSSEPPKPLTTGFDANYWIYEFGDKFLIRTNWKAPLSRIMITPIDKPERKYWQEFIPEAADKLDRSVTIASGDYVFARYLHNAATKIKIFDKSGQYLEDIPFPYIGRGSASAKKKEPGIRVGFASYTCPHSEFDYDMKTGKLTFVKQVYPLKVDVSPYITRQVWYRSMDGTNVSMFLLQRKDIEQNSENPTLLHGYGGFGKAMTPRFAPDFFIWLEAGGMVAIPNLRGGGEYGEEWHKAGIGANKQNSYDDCIAAAEWLIKNKYTNPEKLAFYGVSNGGLLAGAMAVQGPHLFKAVWSDVPFMDMLRFHKFGRSGAWIKQYGNPEDPEQFKYILEYSPYHNVKKGTPYPAVLLTAGENDPRCHPMHAMKMAARLQEVSTSGNPILLHVKKGAGHGTGVLLDKEVAKKARGWAFLMHHLGMTVPET